MKQKFKFIFICLIFLLVPFGVLASPKEMVFTGTVTGKAASRVVVKTARGVVYSPDIGNAKLYRRNGTSMATEEIMPGDKVEVKGTLWDDNSFSAQYLKNMALYAKNSTFSGKIVSVNPSQGKFILQTSQYGLHNITTDQLTSFKKNSKNASLNELEAGMTAQVKGAWERSRENIQAKSVDAKLRLVSIEFAGRLVLKSPAGITVASGNALYGVDISSAKLQNKAGKTVNWNNFEIGQEVKVKGKHPSGDVKVMAESVRITAP